MKEFKLIVAGGRDFNDYQLVVRVLLAMEKTEFADVGVSIVSGMARGADSLGVRFAKEHDVTLHMFPADWDKHGKSAGHRRNRKMGDAADGLLAFWDGKSKGTEGMIQYMKSLGKQVTVITY
jgi:hypothetical protein